MEEKPLDVRQLGTGGARIAWIRQRITRFIGRLRDNDDVYGLASAGACCVRMESDAMVLRVKPLVGIA